MKFSDAISIEKRKDINDLYNIHFYREAEWWRGYEWSAYLVNLYGDSINLANKLKPNKKSLKGTVDGIIFVGLKASSFKKYFPDFEFKEGSDVDSIVINAKDIIDKEFSLETYEQELSNWKNTFSVKEVKPLANNHNVTENNTKYNIDLNDVTMKSIYKEILTYPLEGTTCREHFDFISKIKLELIKLL